MFGRNNTDITNTNQGANSVPDQQGIAVNGYVSPYGSPAATNNDTANMANTQADPQQSPQTLSTGTDNLLDDPIQVNQILNNGGLNIPSPVIANPLPANQQLGTNAIETLIPTDQANNPIEMPITPVSNQEQVSISLEDSATVPSVADLTSEKPLSTPVLESLATPSGAYAENTSVDTTLNPEVDLLSPIADDPNGDIITNVKVNDFSIKELLDIVIQKNASDLHLTVGYPASIRIDSKLERIGDPLTPDQVKKLIHQTLSPNQKELLEVNKEVDLSYDHDKKARFRVNAYNERGNLAAAYRLIPTRIKTLEELRLPPALYDFTKIPQGLFLVTGPTGHGKSTTLAAMLQEINEHYAEHIITIEDPIEYVYPQGRALVDQRELGEDTHDWSIALKSILRQDPDVVLIGEMRDFETIQSAITISETGHLVFATLHTNSAAQSIDRIIDVFPPHQQEQIRTQLAGSLKGILSQRLIPKLGGGREAAIELMIVTPAIQNLIREGKTYQIDNVISTSYDMGMVTLERSLVKMVREGKITVEMAQEYAIRPEEILKLMKSGA